MKTRNKKKGSVHHCAAENNNTEIASVLLKLLKSWKKSFLISSPKNHGWTTFYWSCSQGYLELSKWLLEDYKNCKSESDPLFYTIQDNDGDTPLMLAVTNHHDEIVSWLVSIDPDCMNTQNKNKRSVLHDAAANNNNEIASVLLNALKSSDRLSLISSPDIYWSCSKGYLEFSKWLLEDYQKCKSESDPLLHRIQDNNGYTPLMLAVAKLHLEIVGWLASIDPACMKTRNRKKNEVYFITLLQTAILKKHLFS